MAPQEQYDFEKLAREIVISRLKGLPNLKEKKVEVSVAAVGTAKEMIVSAIHSTQQRQDPHLTFMAVCRGVLMGLMILETDLAPAAVDILKSIPQLARDLPIASQDLMTWAMEGMAQVAVVAGHSTQSAIYDGIRENFMGAEAVFEQLCAQAQRISKP